MASATPKGKRGTPHKSMSMAEKSAILAAFHAGTSKNNLAKLYNRDPKVIRRIIASGEKIKQAFEDGCGANRKRLTPSPLADIEEDLVAWVRKLLSNNTPITGNEMKVSFFKLMQCFV